MILGETSLVVVLVAGVLWIAAGAVRLGRPDRVSERPTADYETMQQAMRRAVV